MINYHNSEQNRNKYGYNKFMDLFNYRNFEIPRYQRGCAWINNLSSVTMLGGNDRADSEPM